MDINNINECMNEVLYCFKHYNDISGRANGKEFWFFVCFLVIVNVIGFYIDKVLALSFPWVSTVVMGGLILPFIAVFIRRLHDIGKSGWYLLLWFIPLVNFLLLYYICQSGEPRPNRYGPIPPAAR